MAPLQALFVLVRPALAICLFLLVAGCGPATQAPRPDPAVSTDAAAAPHGRIVFDCTPPEAQIVVDGTPRGTARELSRAGGLSLAFGLHRFEITCAGYHPFRIELNLGATPERLSVQLKPATGAPP